MKNELKDVRIQFVGSKEDGYLRLGIGISSEVGKIVEKWGDTLLVTDKTIVKFGLHKALIDSLKEHKVCYDVFDEVEAEPDISVMEKAYAIARERNYSAVVGIGGGSVLDTAKAVALALGSKETPERLFENISLAKESLPLILLPTTSGTGSEVSPYSVASKNGKKIFISSPKLYARVALVDPLLTVSMPPRVTAATGMDALSHAVEGVMGETNPITLAFATQAVKLVFGYLSKAVKDGSDIEARYYMSFASVLGMLAYTQGGGLYAHSLSYLMTAENKTPHGVGCGLALPYCINYNKEYILTVIKTLCVTLNIPETAEALSEKLFSLQKEVGLPTTLKEAGIREEQLEKFSKMLFKDYFRAKNPRPMNEQKAREFIRSVYNGNYLVSIN